MKLFLNFVQIISRQFLYIYGILYWPVPRRSITRKLDKLGPSPLISDNFIRLMVVNLFCTELRGEDIALHSRAYGRFGNQVAEVLIALVFALHAGVRRVIVSNAAVFQQGKYEICGIEVTFVSRDEFGRIDGLPGRHNTSAQPPRVIVDGAFFPNWLSYRFSLLDSDTNLVRKAITQLLRFRLEEKPFPGKDLAVSFRGGDVFSTDPHPLYGQPPLSYYQLATLTMPEGMIRIAAEDMVNPAAGLYIDWLREIGREFILLPFSPEVHANVIYNSSRVISPQTTFVPAVVSLSPFVKTMTFMGDLQYPLGNVEIRWVVDLPGEFVKNVMNNNWEASEDQLTLIETYPITSLEIQDKALPGMVLSES